MFVAWFCVGIREEDSAVGLWAWARPDVQTYALLVRGLAACLRVPDAIRIIKYVTNVGVPSEEEVVFSLLCSCNSTFVLWFIVTYHFAYCKYWANETSLEELYLHLILSNFPKNYMFYQHSPLIWSLYCCSHRGKNTAQ